MRPEVITCIIRADKCFPQKNLVKSVSENSLFYQMIKYNADFEFYKLFLKKIYRS